MIQAQLQIFKAATDLLLLSLMLRDGMFVYLNFVDVIIIRRRE